MKTHMLTPLLHEVLSLFYSKEFVFGGFSGILHRHLTPQIIRVELCNLIYTKSIDSRQTFFSFPPFCSLKCSVACCPVKILFTAKSKFYVVYDLYLAAGKTKSSFFFVPKHCYTIRAVKFGFCILVMVIKSYSSLLKKNDNQVRICKVAVS